jgi:NAD(P)-dependent dehydrogenase (short-subunit alcohol dehydrogenase family)
MRLQNKVALVIGASRGSGQAIALELAREGADVIVASRTERAGQSKISGTITQTAQEIQALGRRALAVKVDLAHGEEIDNLYNKTIEAFGGVDILVHSIQYMGPGYVSPFVDTTVEQLEVQLRVNLLSAMHITRLVTPQMIERGRGTILLLTSAAGWYDPPGLPGDASTGLGYPVSKAGLNRFVAAASKELRPHNIAIVALDPGFTLAEHVTETAVNNLWNGWDIRQGHGLDVPAKTAGYLCSAEDQMPYTGKIVVADDFVQEHGLVPA